MPRYRKMPVVVEAFQMTEERRWDNSEWPTWLHEAWNRDITEGALFVSRVGNPDNSLLSIGTKEGVMSVSWDDWIIQGVQGEIYPCKPDIFESTYELIGPTELEKALLETA